MAACSKSEAATDPTASARGPMAPAAAVQETPNYKVTLKLAGPYKKDQQGIINIVLVTKGDYHINKQYPYKFVTADPPADGVAYPKKTVRREDGSYEEKKAVLPVPFVASKTGDVQVGGVFSLSVCTDANCLMDKQRLEVNVKVE